MIDATTKRPLYVSTDGTDGPYTMVPVTQLAEVRQLLAGHRIRYQVEEEAISLNGVPEVAVIDSGRGADAKAV